MAASAQKYPELKTKKIYLIRHGETDYNRRGVVQGRGIDASLNELGRSQADAFYQAYKETKFQKVYTSELVRTHQSVKGFLDLGLMHEKHSGLDEIDWGEKEGTALNLGSDEYFNEIVKEWSQGNTHVPVIGGESPDDVARRQKPALSKILSDPEELVLVCMHGRAIRILLCVMLDYPISRMDEFPHSNLGLYILSHDGSKFTIEAHNLTDHI